MKALGFRTGGIVTFVVLLTTCYGAKAFASGQEAWQVKEKTKVLREVAEAEEQARLNARHEYVDKLLSPNITNRQFREQLNRVPDYEKSIK